MSPGNYDSNFCNKKTVPWTFWLWRACNLTAFKQSSTGPVVHHLLPVMRDPGSIPRGILMWNWDSPVSVVSLHWWPRRDCSLWPHLRRASYRTDTRPSCRLCDNPTWSHTALLSRFHAHCRSSFRLHNWHSRLLGGGGALWRACNLTAFIHSSKFQWFTCLLPVMRAQAQSPGGYLCETGILLLALSRYMIQILGNKMYPGEF